MFFAVKQLWRNVLFFLTVFLFAAHFVNLSAVLPSPPVAHEHIHSLLTARDTNNQCNMCGTSLQYLANSMLNLNNPFYGGRRISRAEVEPLPRYVSLEFCNARPCLPECQEFITRTGARLTTESFQSYNRTYHVAYTASLDFDDFLNPDPGVLLKAAARFSQLMSDRFTMGSAAERATGVARLRPPGTSIAPDHEHSIDRHGRCSICGAFVPESHCLANGVERFVTPVPFSALHPWNRPLKQCTTCGLVQEVLAPYTVHDTRYAVRSNLVTSAWFMDYLRNEDSSRACYAFCEGQLPWWERAQVGLLRAYVDYRVFECASHLYSMPFVVWFALLLGFRFLAHGPQQMMFGNLLWRNALRGIADETPDPVAFNTSSGKIVPSNALSGSSRTRRK